MSFYRRWQQRRQDARHGDMLAQTDLYAYWRLNGAQASEIGEAFIKAATTEQPGWQPIDPAEGWQSVWSLPGATVDEHGIWRAAIKRRDITIATLPPGYRPMTYPDFLDPDVDLTVPWPWPDHVDHPLDSRHPWLTGLTAKQTVQLLAARIIVGEAYPDDEAAAGDTLTSNPKGAEPRA